MIQKVNIPPNACLIHKCANCITAFETYILTDEGELVKPTNFILESDPQHETDTGSTIYECSSAVSEKCNCLSHACTGPNDFCKIFNCSLDAHCKCHLTHEQAVLKHIGLSPTINNPTLININICLYETKTRPSRKLLESEQANFTQNHLTLQFNDPILTLPEASGRLILRTDNYESIMVIENKRHLTIPFELLAHKTVLTVIFISDNGLSVTAEINIEGKKICRLATCTFCKDNLKTFKCWNFYARLAFVVVVMALLLAALCMTRLIIETVSWVALAIFKCFFLFFRVLKMAARFCLLLGSFIGSSVRNAGQRIHRVLEEGGRQERLDRGMALALLAMCLLVHGAVATCSDYTILKSDIKLCEHSDAMKETCKMSSSAELTLSNIGHDACVWFHTRENRPLFSLKLKLEQVECHFSTERLYFTFPVEIRYKSQISCPQNAFCSYGKWCGVYSPEGLKFEAETWEARSYSGFSTCEPSGRGNGCTLIHTASCAFKRVYFVPNLQKSYEVSRVTGFTCAYHIAMEHSQNETISRFTVRDHTVLPGGIEVKLLGAFDQPTMFITQKLVTRVDNPSEGYLVNACDKNSPRADAVGAIQANTSTTKDFLFADDMTKCEFFEDKLRCVETIQALEIMEQTQVGRLPISKEFHQMHLKNGVLKSRLLASSAVKIHMQFSDYQISLQRETVCPLIEGDEYEVTGCYRCGIHSELTLRARSSCKEGLAAVTFETLQIYTKAVQLKTEFTQIVIKFLAEEECYEDKVCLTSITNIQCRKVSFCVDEPSIELLQMQGKQKISKSEPNSGSIFDWVHFKGLNSAFFIFKFAGAILFSVGLFITILSTCITCLCRR